MIYNNYEFNIGDEVITVDGEKGKIVDICECEYCIERGFPELTWKRDFDGSEGYITHLQAKRNFSNFYRIGKHRFGEFDKAGIQLFIDKYERILEGLRDQLRVIEEIEKEDLIFMSDMNLTQVSRFISLILRHKPEEVGITLDEHGGISIGCKLISIRNVRT